MTYRFDIDRFAIFGIDTRQDIQHFLYVWVATIQKVLVNAVFCVLWYLHVSIKTVIKSVHCHVVMGNCLLLRPVNRKRTEETVATYCSPDFS